MVRQRHRPVPAESTDLRSLSDATEVAEPSPAGVSPEEIPDPDYTTYEDVEGTITAPVRLPPRESMAVRLAPVNLVDRLEEYQSDENLGHTLIGLFAGAALGIIINWFTTPGLLVPATSVVLLIVLVVIAVGVAIWLFRLKRRKRGVRNELEGLST